MKHKYHSVHTPTGNPKMLFAKFLSKFYESKEFEAVAIESMLNQNYIPVYKDPDNPKGMTVDAEGLNNFLYDIGNVAYKEEVDVFRKSNQFHEQYCQYVKSIQVESKYNNIYETPAYLALSQKLIDAATEYEEHKTAMEDKRADWIEQKKTEFENRFKDMYTVREKLDEAVTRFRDRGGEEQLKKLQHIMDGARMEQEKLLQGVPPLVSKLLFAKVKCTESSHTEIATSYNMPIGQDQYVPVVQSSKPLLRKMAKALSESETKKIVTGQETAKSTPLDAKSSVKELKEAAKKFHALSEDQKLKCGANSQFSEKLTHEESSYFTTTSNMAAQGLLGLSKLQVGLERGTSKGSQQVGCVSFDNVLKVALRFPWLDEDIYRLEFKPDGEGAKEGTEGIRLDPQLIDNNVLKSYCHIPSAVILGLKPMYYWNLQSARESNTHVDTQIKKGLGSLAGSSVHSDNSWGSLAEDQNELFGRVEDSFVILGYELENLCPLNSTLYDHI